MRGRDLVSFMLVKTELGDGGVFKTFLTTLFTVAWLADTKVTF